jgi:1-phosphofructokinase
VTSSSGSVMVFEPSPLLTVTVERKGDLDDVHLHAGGQGFWIARMLAALEVPLTVCCPFGGETGIVVKALVEHQGMSTRSVAVQGANAGYVHDRRSGDRRRVAEMAVAPLSRHELDELYSVALTTGLESTVCVLAGSRDPAVLPDDTYRRLACDLRENGRTVVADLSGAQLRAAVEGGIDVLKVSHVEFSDDGWTLDETERSLVDAMRRLHALGVGTVVVSRAERPALALVAGEIFEVDVPLLEELDHRGAGDSMTAGVAAGLARGGRIEEAIRLGAAAGALNVTRHGLASGNRDAIERLAERITLSSCSPPGPVGAAVPVTATPEELAERARPTS